MTLGAARSKIVSEPNGFILAMKYGERGTWASRSSPSRPAPKLNVLFTQERSLHNDPEDTEREDMASKTKNRRVYKNRHGEEIIFGRCYPPSGYVFVPFSDAFITRRCRKVAQKNLYAAYRHRTRKKPAKQIGLYVPSDIFDKVNSEFEAKRAKRDEKLWRDLNRDYPQMPPADKKELHRLISLLYPGVTGKSPLDRSTLIIYDYVRDRYTPFKSLDYRGGLYSEAIARAHERAREILAAWRGEDSSKKRDA